MPYRVLNDFQRIPAKLKTTLRKRDFAEQLTFRAVLTQRSTLGLFFDFFNILQVKTPKRFFKTDFFSGNIMI